MGIKMIPPHKLAVRIKQGVFIKCLAQCLAHGKSINSSDFYFMNNSLKSFPQSQWKSSSVVTTALRSYTLMLIIFLKEKRATLFCIAAVSWDSNAWLA